MWVEKTCLATRAYTCNAWECGCPYWLSTPALIRIVWGPMSSSDLGWVGPKEFDKGIERHTIEGVSVPIYVPAKTIVDLFKSGQRQKAFYNAPAGLAHATQAMKDALRLRKATPSEIAKYAVEAGIWEKVVQPRLETLTVNA
ncbi:hypothetical protein SAMN05444171_6690 [Bradyrhizobium lablabi]|uniref:Uncharacterized protein n=3 Tax=Nitrobacteraceae TaxID=41294 RepID=A0ABY0P7J0_9BRAD|nr:hypothetical protein SAMN05444163_0478 [Bradyrhizobium ottawaense]SEE21774.1 hypothetical protein SAMN05444171_6690 [Bradyrhizobium lablabi]SHM18011.1 hypothetical protein SAMN05444321_5490 [Bradyrhizobium lablabi]